tara:strand:- start:58 stop:306 length:249 start_codon:yes stop_codon:yes gene_type:complete
MNKMRITNHFIERFNLRYLGKDEDWKIQELKGYMKKVFKSYQLKHLERRKNFDNAQYIHFGDHHYLVVRNNTFVTILNRKKN